MSDVDGGPAGTGLRTTNRARRARFVVLAAVVAVTVVVGWYLVVDELPAGDDLATPAVLTGVALAVIVPGLVAEWRRPRDRVAWVVVVLGVGSVLADFRLLRPGWVATIGAASFFALPLVACHVLLALPDGIDRVRRWRAALACWVAPAVLAAGTLLFTGPRHTSPDLRTGGVRAASWSFAIQSGTEPRRWFRQGNVLHRFDSDATVRVLWVLWAILVVAVTVGTVVVLARRYVRAASAERRAVRLLLAVSVAVVAGGLSSVLGAYPERARVVAGAAVGSVLQSHWYANFVNVLPALAAAALGGVLLWGELVRPRLGRETNGAIQLEWSTAATLGEQLQRALGDATARLLYPRDDGSWVDGAGRPVEPAGEAGRAATIVTRGGVPVAAVEHDDWLLTQPDLVDVAVASVALTLEGGRLAAVALASTEDIQASAVRLLDAAEHARRDVERRIDEGPERTLAGVAALLAAAPVPLDAVHAGLRTAVAEVREIAHGIAPAGLAEDGLATALDDLAATAECELTVGDVPTEPLPVALETTVFLLARDAVRHARGPLTLAVARAGGGNGKRDENGSESHQGGMTEQAIVRIDGWTGPLDQLVDDRVRTLGGRATSDAGGVTVTLPLAGG